MLAKTAREMAGIGKPGIVRNVANWMMVGRQGTKLDGGISQPTFDKFGSERRACRSEQAVQVAQRYAGIARKLCWRQVRFAEPFV